MHKARTIRDRLPKGLHAPVRKTPTQAWELKDTAKAEQFLRNLAQRLEKKAPDASGSILEGHDEILTVSRLGLPDDLRPSLVCTNIIENIIRTIRRMSRNAKCWCNAEMALRWTAAGMLEAKEGFRRINAYRQLSVLDAALKAHQGIHAGNTDIDRTRSHAQFGPGGGDGDVVALLPAVQKQPCISGSIHA